MNDIPLWQIDHSEQIADCKIFTVRRDHTSVPHTDRQGTFYVLESPNWVNILPVTDDGHVLFVQQFRHGTQQITLETPGGMIEPEETPEQAAARELREETGYTARSFRVLGATDANPAFMTNSFTAVLAEGARQTDPTAWDEHEELAPRLVPISELADLLHSGAIRNTYSALPLALYLLERMKDKG